MMKRLNVAILCLALLLAQIAPTFAAVTATPVFPQTPKNNVVQFLQGTDTAGTYKTLVTAGSNGTKCVGMYATSNDASASHLLTVQIVRSSVKYGGVAITIPISAGYANGVAQIALMTAANWVGLPLDSDGNLFFYLESGDTVQATFATALTSTDVLNVIAVCADF
jgi:hypothetical protein